MRLLGRMEWKHAYRSPVAFTVAFALSLWSVDGRGQAQSRTPRFKAGVELVSVDVCVRDPSGHFMPIFQPLTFSCLKTVSDSTLSSWRLRAQCR